MQVDIKTLHARKDDLWFTYGNAMPDKWPAGAREELRQIDELLDHDWDRRCARMARRKQKRLAQGKEWLTKRLE